MSSRPHQMNIGWLVLSSMRTAVRRLCGQVSGFPSGRADQSIGARQRAHFPAAGEKIRRSQTFDLQHQGRSVAGSVQTSSRNLIAGHIAKPATRHLVPIKP